MSAWIRAACASHEGRVRSYDEDACAFREDRGTALAVVADGMGASTNGRPAADLTIATCEAVFDRRFDQVAEVWWGAEHDPGVMAWSAVDDEHRADIQAHAYDVWTTRVTATPGDLAILEREAQILAAIAHRALVEANRAVYARSTSDMLWRGMGSTSVAAVFARGCAGIAHAGDARIYRVRDGLIEQLTEDHTLLREYMAAQRLTPDEIEAFPYKGVITRAIGMTPEVVVDTRVVETRPGDLFLLCTDGLSNTFDDDVLRRAVEDRRCDAAHELVERARHSERNRDNATAIVIDILV